MSQMTLVPGFVGAGHIYRAEAVGLSLSNHT